MSDDRLHTAHRRGRAIDLGFKLLLVALAGLWLVFPRIPPETRTGSIQTEARR